MLTKYPKVERVCDKSIYPAPFETSRRFSLNSYILFALCFKLVPKMKNVLISRIHYAILVLIPSASNLVSTFFKFVSKVFANCRRLLFLLTCFDSISSDKASSSR